MADQDIQIRFRSVREGSGGQEQIDELDDLRERIDKLHQETRDLIESTDDLGDAGTRSSTKLDDLISIERAQVAAQIAEVVNRLAGALQSMAGELEAIDPEAADKLNDVGLAVQSLGLGAELAAKGFAVGGPMGAALGGFVGLATGPVKGAFQGMIADLKAAKIATDQAAKAEEALKQVLQDRADAARRSNLSQLLKTELDAINETSAALERQVRLLESRRAADERIRQAQQAESSALGIQAPAGSEIRGDITSQVQRLLDGIAAASGRADIAAQTAGALRADADRLEEDRGYGVSESEVQQARAAAEAALKAAENAQAEVAVATQEAIDGIRAISQEGSTAITEEAIERGEGIRKQAEDAIAETADLASESVAFFRERVAAAIQAAGATIDTQAEASAIINELQQLQGAASRERAEMIEVLRDNIQASEEGKEAIRALSLQSQSLSRELARLTEQIQDRR